ncbi:hypothetical protein AC578_5398 [Pseudocercospora eumusae]|uniref:Uncharacterized protein n=1 Tax=Pseudocercospora eumusae TaxID=321146 RepID=A0A139HK74_9PEZI|nr:hypothetical protein AC578_5398 [Pseudocercospora eumusae]
MLSRESLNKPSSVVILRDLPKGVLSHASPDRHSDGAPDVSTRHPRLSAKDIENSILTKYQAPDTKEVNASIAENQSKLRSTILDEKEFDELAQKLNRAYTSPQLSRYLFATLEASAGRSVSNTTVDRNIQNQHVMQWQPGQTPLAQRHEPIRVQATGQSKKLRTIEQILRVCWHITITSEEQEIGELELKLEPWQLSMLFDLHENDEPYYKSLLRTKMLLDTTEVQQYRPDAVVRITGRRTDAEDAAWQLKSALMSVQPLRMDAAQLLPQRDAGARNRFSDEELGYVSNLTKSVLSLDPDGVVVIYNRTTDGRNNARRLLLSILRTDESSFAQVLSLSKDTGNGDPWCEAFSLPSEPSTGDMHRRWAGRDLVREMTSTQRRPCATNPQPVERESKSPEVIDAVAQAIAAKLQTVKYAWNSDSDSAYPFHAGSYWGPGFARASANWSCGFIRHLQDLTPRSDGEFSSEEPELSRRASREAIPGLDALLSYFDTNSTPKPLQLLKSSVPISYVGEEEAPQPRIDWRLPYLAAVLLPLPTKSLPSVQLPRVVLRFNFAKPTQPGRPRNVFLSGLKADMDYQNLVIPLPNQAVDLRFSRGTVLIGRDQLAKQDKHIRYFTRQIQRSILTGDGVLSAPPELILRLPYWLVHPDADRSSVADEEDVPVTYLFERFRQEQKVEFSVSEAARTAHGVDPEIREMAMQLPSSLRLQYREIDGGAIYGDSSAMTLVHRTKRKRPVPQSAKASESQAVDALSGVLGETHAQESSKTEKEDLTQQLAASALRIAHLLTRFNAGTLSAFRRSDDFS